MRSRRACRARPNRWSSPRSWLHEHGADKHAVHSCNGHPMNRQAPISPAQREEAGLLDVLPLAATGQAGEGACDVAFPPPLARDWATALATGVDADILLCAALAIAEARLTGADVVVATLAGSRDNRQGSLDVARAARIESLLLQAGALGRVESLAPVAWAASAAGAEVDLADEAPNSLWTISTSADAPSLAIRYRAPLDSEAVALLADAVLRAIADRKSTRLNSSH